MRDGLAKYLIPGRSASASPATPTLISVVGNYRAQFDRILRRDSYEALIAHLRAKITELSVRVKAAP
jgi:hypothetical protein